MTVKWVAIAVLVSVCVPGFAWAQGGDAAAGKTYWNGPAAFCRNCHGADGEGGYGPELAGRPLTVAQFTRAVRQPWGVMPSFTEQQLSAANIANLIAYFSSLPRVAEPAPWRVPVNPSTSLGAQLGASHGCAQCHGADFANLRQALGAVAPDFPWFMRLVYNHTSTIGELEAMLGNDAPVRMGDYSPLRVPEPVLQEIWKHLTGELGLRARIQARLQPGQATATGTTFTVTVTNNAPVGKGLTAEDLALNLVLPAGMTVSNTTGVGYQGARKDERGADVVTWRFPRMAAKDVQTFTITLAGTTPAIASGTVTWVKPAVRAGAANDSLNIQIPRPAATQ